MKRAIRKPAKHVSTMLAVGIIFIAAAVGIILPGASSSAGQSDASRSVTSASSDAVTVHASGRGGAYLRLKDGREMGGTFTASSKAALSIESKQLEPLSLASGDFNGDGTADVVAGYAGPGGGVVALHRGNPRSVSPRSDELASGASPFLESAIALELPEAPDFLSAGDFDADGRHDIVAARRNSSTLYLLAGDGKGEFASAAPFPMPGRVTALLAGDVNSRDGITDLIVGIVGDAGPAVAVFQSLNGALRSEPALYPLPSEASAIAAGQLDDDGLTDIAVAAGRQVVVIHGKARRDGDGRLPRIETINHSFIVRSIALGDYIPDRGHRIEMALLARDGRVHLAARGSLDTRPYSEAELQIRRRAIDEGDAEADAAWQNILLAGRAGAGDNSSWNIVETVEAGAVASGRVSAQSLLVAGSLSNQPGDELLVLNESSDQLQILLQGEDAQHKGEIQTMSPGLRRSTVPLDVEGGAVAALPMRLNADGEADLVVLRRGQINLSVVFTIAASFTVNTVADTPDANTADGLCADAGGNCSLRAAIQQANATVGADTITLPTGTFTLLIPGNDNVAALGDLDILDSVTLVGNGSANTIIQAGLTTATGIDRVFDINPVGDKTVVATFQNLTIRNGRLTSSLNSSGGGIRFDGFNFIPTVTTDGVLNVTNCVVSDCEITANNSRGAGIRSQDGTFNISGSTVSNNRETNGTGAGIDHRGPKPMTMTTTTVSGNTAEAAVAVNGRGAGIFLLQTLGATVTTIQTSTISNNQAENKGGGIYMVAPSIISNATVVSGNTVGSVGAPATPATSNGGGIYSDLDPTTAGVTGDNALDGVTIKGNTATGNGGGIFHDRDSLTINKCTIGGPASGDSNSAANGGGIATHLDVGSAGQIGALNIQKTTIVGNLATNQGGAILNGGPSGQAGRSLTMNFSRITGNTAGDSASRGLRHNSGVLVDITNNWWGCNLDPISGFGCDTVFGTGTAHNPRLRLNHSASPSTIPVGGSTTLTADFLTNSNNTPISPSNLDVLIGLPIAFTNAMNGTISGAQTTIQPSGTATATFTATAAGTGSADAVVDNGVATATINVTGVPPTITCPANITTNNDPNQCGAVVNYPAPTATGTPTPTVTCSPASGSFFPVGTTTVTCTASNGVPPNATCSFTVTVNDNQAPTVTCPANVTQSNDPNQCGAVVTYAPTASDNCPGVTVTASPASGSFFPKGTTTVTATATDASGNTATCQFTVTVNDTQPPSITCPANVTVSNDPNQCGAVVNYPAPTASDNCPGVSVSSSPASGSFFPVGTTTVTATATDASGNTATCQFTVTVNDTQNPTITCPANMTVGNSPGQCGAVVTYAPTASDNCPGVTVTASPASGSFFPKGTTTVTATATDASGNTATCQFTVTVNDTENPTVTCPANVTQSNDPNQCGAVVNYPAPTASDNCPGVTITASPASGSFFPKGTTTVTATATDTSGNTATCQFTVTVNDTQNPTITCPANITVSNDPNQCGAVVNYSAPTASDNCPGVNVTSSHASGSFFPKGTTTVTATATDSSGNTATCQFTVTVNDTQAPTINCPANMTVPTSSSSCSAVVTFNVTASDNCPGVTVVSAPPSGSTFPKGTTTVTSTATDTSGNTATCQFTVTVVDTTPPMISCPSNIVTSTDPGQCTAVVNYVVTASDNCVVVTVMSAPPSGSAFPRGTTTVTATATDSSGNTATCQFTVTVTNQDPAATITGPPSGSIYSVGTPVNFTGTFTDNAGDVHTATWTYASNITTISQAGTVNEATGSVTATQTFTQAGVYLVTLTVTDQCGGSDIADTVDGLTALVVIYDPNGGFVTGGGWINSPPGAYTPNPALTGKASFGFVAKYKPGRSVPDGNTEFQFRVANFNFKSTEYDFLVIAGHKATFKGSGTVNGQGDYEFQLQAIDGQANGGGGTDKFRIRIKNKSNNQVIYDNEITNGENDDPTTVLGGGNIVIHKD